MLIYDLVDRYEYSPRRDTNYIGQIEASCGGDPPTDAGRELALVLAAFMTWGDKHLADASGPPALLRTSDGERPVRLVFVDDDDVIVPPGDVISIPAPRRAGGRRSRPAKAREVRR